MERIRSQLAARLRARSAEIEEAIFDRLRLMSMGGIEEDSEYSEGLRAAIAACLEYGLAGIEQGEALAPAVPPAAAAQARRAAREGVSLDTVLRRYTAGDRMLAEFVLDESEGIPDSLVRRVLRAQGPQLDRVMASVADEYERELERIGSSPSQRLAGLVRGLLDGAPVGAEELEYDLDAWHLGAIAVGEAAEEGARALAAALDRRLLAVPQGEGIVWAWLGGRRPASVEAVERRHAELLPDGVSLALGEPRQGVEGWRLTHHEAQAAAQVMSHRGCRFARGRDSVLLAAVLRDENLARSLLQTYLAPLDASGRDGSVARRTLRAYLGANGNTAAAAAALEVDRHTVRRRLDRIEEQLGGFLHECNAELKVALDLDELDGAAAAARSARDAAERDAPSRTKR